MELIVRALTRVRSDGRALTDDTAACEHAGIPVWVVESAQPNPKVTYPSDSLPLCQLASCQGEGVGLRLRTVGLK